MNIEHGLRKIEEKNYDPYQNEIEDWHCKMCNSWFPWREVTFCHHYLGRVDFDIDNIHQTTRVGFCGRIHPWRCQTSSSLVILIKNIANFTHPRVCDTEWHLAPPPHPRSSQCHCPPHRPVDGVHHDHQEHHRHSLNPQPPCPLDCYCLSLRVSDVTIVIINNFIITITNDLIVIMLIINLPIVISIIRPLRTSASTIVMRSVRNVLLGNPEICNNKKSLDIIEPGRWKRRQDDSIRS